MTDEMKIDSPLTVTIEPREDGGIRVSSPDEPGLILSGERPALVMWDILPALEALWTGRDCVATRCLEAVRSATGPDRWLDRRLAVLVGLSSGSHDIPRYTGSVDAAVSLLHDTLPGWGWRGGTCCVSDDCFVFPDYNSPEHGERLKREFPQMADGQEWVHFTDIDRRPPGNVPLAILESILTALAAIERMKNAGDARDADDL